MTLDTQALVQPGDKAPFWYGMAAGGGFCSSEDRVGRPSLLILAGPASPDGLAGLIAAVEAQAGRLAALGADAIVLVSADPRWAALTPPHGLTLIHCPGPVACTVADPKVPQVLALDRSQRVLARWNEGEPQGVVEAALCALAGVACEPAREIVAPAPVLITPNLISPAFRRALIDHFEASAHTDGAMASVDADGRPISRIDAAKKHRRDGTLEPGTPLHATVIEVLGRRLLPEIKKAFQTDIAHVDRILIARYDESGGYFRRHRDNSAEHVAFRQFAVSLNLNTGEYDGGGLVFPEFSDHVHQPPAGAACVFSASLLHEATPVTRGARYVLLTFLHDAAAEARRLAGVAEAA